MIESNAQRRVLLLSSQMRLTPQAFINRWGVDYQELAQLCSVSKSTTYHWLGGQTSRRTAGEAYQRILALTDFLLTQAEPIRPLLEDWQQSQGS